MICEEGSEFDYTTVDSNGNFIISGIEPGSYTLKLDESYMQGGALTWIADENSIKKGRTSGQGVKIDIPFSFRKFVDIENVKLNYRTL
ncbi:hypothetical protein tpqmel_0933 [Candidatus Gastranaerophilus sp. (ex Termes propinquus)]|nr:hypothetical protein tpqmel_0933 [Candidatus Gastranaerophilus sp. (ex Termes propinquus)]